MPSRPKSIQSEARKHGKSIASYLNEKSRKGAFNAGLPWSSEDVSFLAGLIERDETTFDMASQLGRTYYGVAAARAHITFAMRHASVLKAYIK
jgi:hypothetical protein